MTSEQYARWQDFAERMARTYPGASRATRAWLVGAVGQLIGWIVCNVKPDAVSGWDETDGDDCASTRVDQWLWDNAAVDGPREDGDGNETSAYRRWLSTYGNRAACCVRAGLDVAVAPSGGVVGFTVGDLKRMYPEGIPAWVSEGYVDDGGKPVDLNACDPGAGVWL